MISFKISIFALSNTTKLTSEYSHLKLWLALKLVSLHYQIQRVSCMRLRWYVVISFKISIFALSNTTCNPKSGIKLLLWLALKLVSLHYQIQLCGLLLLCPWVVISFKISIFALSNTTDDTSWLMHSLLWLALKLVSLHYQIQLVSIFA